VRENDTTYHEDLQIHDMVKNHHLAKSIRDAGWATFLSILTYKAACADREVIAVDPAFTSQRLLAVAFWSRRGALSGDIVARTAARACAAITTPQRIESGSGRAVGKPWCRPRRRTENLTAEAVRAS
jgi:IS605 OrfB family transposase